MKKSNIIHGDSREVLKHFKGEFDLIVTSPPYADARKKHYDSIHPDEFANWFFSFNEAFQNSLKPNGSLVINIKDKVVDGARHRFVWETVRLLENNGWHSIDDYIWYKTNPMPGFWPTRLRDGWEYCFHLSKSKKPYMNFDAVRKPIGDWAVSRLANLSDTDKSRHNSVNDSGFGRDLSKWVDKKSVLPSNVLSMPLVGKNKGHPAVFPIGLPQFFIKLLTPENGNVLDPFAGSGTTGIAAAMEKRQFTLIDNNLIYCKQSKTRLEKEANLNINVDQTFFKINKNNSQRTQRNIFSGTKLKSAL